MTWSDTSDNPNSSLDDLLRDGIAAARAGQLQRARSFFLRALEQDPDCVPAWLWLSDVVDTDHEKELCLEKVLSLEPGHDMARQGLDRLRAEPQPPEPGPLPPPPDPTPESRPVLPPGLPTKSTRPAGPMPPPDPLDDTPAAGTLSPTTAPPPPHSAAHSESRTAGLSPSPTAGLSPSRTAGHSPSPTAAHSPSRTAGHSPSRTAAHSPSRTAARALISDITLDSSSYPAAGMDELMQPAIEAVRSGQAQQARQLLKRVIEVDERYVSAWLWLSYVADSPQERDRCLDRVIRFSVPGTSRAPSPSASALGVMPYAMVYAPAATPIYWPSSPGSTGTSAVAVARPQSVPAPAVYQRLRTLYLEWATTWTLIALAYLAGITIAEIVTNFVVPRLGLAAHALVMLVLLVHAARVEGKKEQAFLVSLAFAPLIRILSLSLPLAQIPLLYWYLITSVPLFAAILVAAPTLGFGWPDLGLNLRRWGLQLVIGLTGIALGVFEYFILRPEPLVPTFDWRQLWWPALILLVSTGLLEEMIFRGLLQRTAGDMLGLWGLGYVAVLFAVLHAGYQSWLDVLFVLLVGLFFAWVVHRTRSLLGVTLAHGLTNIILFLVMPFLHG